MNSFPRVLLMVLAMAGLGLLGCDQRPDPPANSPAGGVHHGCDVGPVAHRCADGDSDRRVHPPGRLRNPLT